MAFFNPLRPSYVEDPYPALARLRAEDPVFHSPELGAWLLTRYTDCAQALHDPSRFRSDFWATDDPRWREGQARTQALLGGAHALSSMAPDDHHRQRGIVSEDFTPRAVAGVRPYIEAFVDRLLEPLIDAARAGQPFDLMASLAHPLPRAVVAEQLGIAEVDRPAVMANIDTVARAIFRASTADESRAATAARDALLGYLTRECAPGAPGSGPSGGGVIARLCAAAGAGDLSADELVALTVDIAMAGNDPTACLIGNGTLALLGHPEEAALLRSQPSLTAGAVDELARFDSPMQALMRVAAEEITLGRKRIRKHEIVYLMLGAANRDPEQFPSPDRLDLRREDRRHLSFGAGPHVCLGAPLARLEVEVALTRLLARFPTLRLAPRGVTREPEFEVRGPKRLLLIAD